MNFDKKETKKDILEATWHLLEENQGLGVRMSDIAKRAGVSRQAVYLHFPTRTDLMIATIAYIDQVKGLNERLERLYNSANGAEMIDATVDVWGNYIPEIYGISKAFLLTKDNDEAAAVAWRSILDCLKDAVRSVVLYLKKEGTFTKKLQVEEAVDIFFIQISVQNWEQFIIDCGWTQDQYINNTKIVLKRVLLK